MEPYRIVENLSLVPNNDNIKLRDILNITPDGWKLGQDGTPLLIQNNELYNYIIFKDQFDCLEFRRDNKLIKVVKVSPI